MFRFNIKKDKDGRFRCFDIYGNDITEKIEETLKDPNDVFTKALNDLYNLDPTQFNEIPTQEQFKETPLEKFFGTKLGPNSLETKTSQRCCDVLEYDNLLNIIAEVSEEEYNQIQKKGNIHYKNKVLTISGINFPVDFINYIPVEKNLNFKKINLRYKNGILEIKIPIKV